MCHTTRQDRVTRYIETEVSFVGEEGGDRSLESPGIVLGRVLVLEESPGWKGPGGGPGERSWVSPGSWKGLGGEKNTSMPASRSVLTSSSAEPWRREKSRRMQTLTAEPWEMLACLHNRSSKRS